MFSKTVLVAGLAAIANLAVAKPILENSIQENSTENSLLEKRGAIEKQNSPVYCQIVGNERAALPYVYIDLSKGKLHHKPPTAHKHVPNFVLQTARMPVLATSAACPSRRRAPTTLGQSKTEPT